MSKKIKLFLICFVILSLCTSAVIYAAGISYDSSTDPLVSLSFLTEIFKPELQSEIREANDNVELVLQAQIDSLTAQIASLTDKLANLTAAQDKLDDEIRDVAASIPPAVEEDGEDAVQVYTVLELKAGDVIVAEEICELVLRSGTATVMTPYLDQGLLDCTDGRELSAGENVPQNHFIVVPRGADGRGITVTSDVAFVMIKGAYSLVEK